MLPVCSGIFSGIGFLDMILKLLSSHTKNNGNSYFHFNEPRTRMKCLSFAFQEQFFLFAPLFKSPTPHCAILKAKGLKHMQEKGVRMIGSFGLKTLDENDMARPSGNKLEREKYPGPRMDSLFSCCQL